MAVQYQITNAQAVTLVDVLRDHVGSGGEGVFFTWQEDGTLVVATGLATIQIDIDGMEGE